MTQVNHNQGVKIHTWPAPYLDDADKGLADFCSVLRDVSDAAAAHCQLEKQYSVELPKKQFLINTQKNCLREEWCGFRVKGRQLGVDTRRVWETYC